jgi:hypothetical protein
MVTPLTTAMMSQSRQQRWLDVRRRESLELLLLRRLPPTGDSLCLRSQMDTDLRHLPAPISATLRLLKVVPEPRPSRSRSRITESANLRPHRTAKTTNPWYRCSRSGRPLKRREMPTALRLPRRDNGSHLPLVNERMMQSLRSDRYGLIHRCRHTVDAFSSRAATMSRNEDLLSAHERI